MDKNTSCFCRYVLFMLLGWCTCSKLKESLQVVNRLRLAMLFTVQHFSQGIRMGNSSIRVKTMSYWHKWVEPVMISWRVYLDTDINWPEVSYRPKKMHVPFQSTQYYSQTSPESLQKTSCVTLVWSDWPDSNSALYCHPEDLPAPSWCWGLVPSPLQSSQPKPNHPCRCEQEMWPAKQRNGLGTDGHKKGSRYWNPSHLCALCA